MALTPDDLPVSPAELADAADSLLPDGGDEENALLILGQLDPYEINKAGSDSAPRWSPDQQALIVKAGRIVKELKES